MTVVRAAGGLVRRLGDDGRWRYVLVHRPRYDDWSLPKGKADAGERAEETARREVEEETGLHCRLLDELRTVEYRDRNGRHKVVRYWLMEPLDTGPLDATRGFRPNAEVDEIRWCAPTEAVKLLTYDHDRILVAERGNLE